MMIYSYSVIAIILISGHVRSLDLSEYSAYLKLLDDPFGEVLYSVTANNLQSSALINRSLLSIQMTRTNEFGLPNCSKQHNECLDIGIVGAGIAGLYCGILLAQAGHTVKIYEASGRAGGRVYTYRDPNNPIVFTGELGAMRFPLAIHTYVATLIEQRYKLERVDFIHNSTDTFAYINDVFTKTGESAKNPNIFKFNITLNEQENIGQLPFNIIGPMLQTLVLGGWRAVRDEWGLYSTTSYLKYANISLGAIDYFRSVISTDPGYLSLLEYVRSMIIFNSKSKFVQLKGGSDALVRSMINECQSIENHRCSIVYSTPVTEIHGKTSEPCQLITTTHMTENFDSIIVATTASAARLIKFESRKDFMKKYRALQEVYYYCSTKILFFFNVSWWQTYENLVGCASVTDLNIRQVCYPSTNQPNGGTILASYTDHQTSLLFQSLSEEDLIDIALQELTRLHRSSSNLRNYFQGGKIQHWCNDPYAHGAFSRFLPFQETDLFAALQEPVSNVHFVGEHTSLIHAWVEGAIVSALRGSLSVVNQRQITYDIVIIGNDPMALITAVFLSIKAPTLRICIIEKESLVNLNLQQLQPMYNDGHINQIANQSLFLWKQLEQIAGTHSRSIINTNEELLLFGNFNLSILNNSSNFTFVQDACKRIACQHLNIMELKSKFPTLTFLNEHEGILYKQSGSVNMTDVMTFLSTYISHNPNITIRHHEEILSYKLMENQTQLTTDRGVLYASRKILFLAGSNSKYISRLFHINIDMMLSEYPVFYFRRHSQLPYQLPHWVAIDDQNPKIIIYGISRNSTTDYIRIQPSFVENIFKSTVHPSKGNMSENKYLSNIVIGWVQRHLQSAVNVSDYYMTNEKFITTTLPNTDHLVDFVRNTNNRILLQATGLRSDFLPYWANMLSDILLSNTTFTSAQSHNIEHFSVPQYANSNIEPSTHNSAHRTSISFWLILNCFNLLLFFLRSNIYYLAYLH